MRNYRQALASPHPGLATFHDPSAATSQARPPSRANGAFRRALSCYTVGMIAPAVPPDEAERLRALRRYQVLDTPPEAAFDDVAMLASQICGTPIALVTLVDASRQWFKARVGLAVPETPRAHAFCAHAIVGSGTMVVAAAAADPRFADNPLVTADPHIRFYAGAPLVTPDGHALGTVCAIDRRPRTLSAAQVEALEALSRQVMAQLELRRTAERLARLMDEQQRFVSMVSHELRTPITAVRGCLQLLGAGTFGALDDEGLAVVRSAGQSVTRLMGVVDDLLDLERAESGRFELAPAPHALAALVTEAFDAVRDLAHRSSVLLEWDGEDHLVLVDAGRIVQVLINLVSNAIRYAPAGTAVVVGTTVEGDEVRVTVDDRGCGVPEDQREATFEPFRQAHAGDRERRGSGLGLTISRSLVRQHGGAIGVEPREGGGSRFWFTLPSGDATR